MRPEFLHDRLAANLPQPDSILEPGAARDLFELLAVVVGVCEALAAGLGENPQHAELARVGRLAADRAATLVSEMRAKPAGDEHAAAADPTLVTPRPAPPRPLVLAPATAAQPARKVLLVEDDPDLLNLLTAAFVREGFETYCAQNGRVGVEMLRDLQPDLMVTDIVMPEMEGIAAILEARRAAPHTRVIAISGGGHYGKSRNFLAWAHELGADEVLAKPFRMSSLITAARVVLGRPSAPIPANETIPKAEAREALGLSHHR
jgi:CheY-like chemotaxis protein